MFYRSFSRIGDYCGTFFGRSTLFYHNPWGIVLGVLGVLLLVVLTVAIVKALMVKKDGESDEMLELLKSRYAAGEIDEEEYFRKRKILKK